MSVKSDLLEVFGRVEVWKRVRFAHLGTNLSLLQSILPLNWSSLQE